MTPSRVREVLFDIQLDALDGMLIKGRHRIDAELKLGHKLFFRTNGVLTRINCIIIDHTTHKIRLAVDGFSRESSHQHTA